MKKILALLLVAVICLSLFACADSNTKIDTGSTENSVLLYDRNGTAYLNRKVLPDLVETVELTTENWREYIKTYSYNIELVEKNAFGEVTSTQIITHYILGAGNERYHFFDGVAIELKSKETGELTIYEFNYHGYEFGTSADFNLDDYECTRIQGYLYYLNIPDEAFSKSDFIQVGEMDGEELMVYSTGIMLDTETNGLLAQGDIIELIK